MSHSKPTDMSHNSQDALSEVTLQFNYIRSCIDEVLTSLSNTHNFLQCINERIKELEEGLNQYAMQAHQTIAFSLQDNSAEAEPNQFPFVNHSELAVQEQWSATNPFIQQAAPIYNDNPFHPYQETTSEDDEVASLMSTDSSTVC